MEPSIKEQLDEQTKKIDVILASVQKTEKYFRMTLWVTIIVFVVPLLAAVFIVPMAINSYLETVQGLL